MKYIWTFYEKIWSRLFGDDKKNKRLDDLRAELKMSSLEKCLYMYSVAELMDEMYTRFEGNMTDVLHDHTKNI